MRLCFFLLFLFSSLLLPLANLKISRQRERERDRPLAPEVFTCFSLESCFRSCSLVINTINDRRLLLADASCFAAAAADFALRSVFSRARADCVSRSSEDDARYDRAGVLRAYRCTNARILGACPLARVRFFEPLRGPETPGKFIPFVRVNRAEGHRGRRNTRLSFRSVSPRRVTSQNRRRIIAR